MSSQRVSVGLSAAALAVAVLGVTPLGRAAGERLAAVVPFAKTARYARLAGNAKKLNGRRSTLKGLAGTIPVVGKNGKLPRSLGAVGPQGPAGPAGSKGDTGPKGDTGAPGVSGYQFLSSEPIGTPGSYKSATLKCPAGKRVVAGGADIYGDGGAHFVLRGSNPTSNGTAWTAEAQTIDSYTGDWSIYLLIVCANVVS